MHSTKFLAAILAVAGTGLAMPLEAPIATPASPSAAPAVEGLKESWVGCDNGHCPPENPSPKERWAAKKAKMPKKTSKPNDLSPGEFEKKVDEFWAEKIKKFEERLAAKKANKPESPPKPADSPCNKDKRDAAVDAACATDDDGFRKLSPEALSAILNAAPGPVVAKSMPAAADKILPNDAVEKIRGRPGPGVVAPTAAVSGPFKLTKRPARTSSATGKPTASSATSSSTAATATGTTTPKVTSVGVTGTPALPSPATGTATNTTGTATGTTAPTKAHLAARDYPSNFADLVRVGPQIEKKTATAISHKTGRMSPLARSCTSILVKLAKEGRNSGEVSTETNEAMKTCLNEAYGDWVATLRADTQGTVMPFATPEPAFFEIKSPVARSCLSSFSKSVQEHLATGKVSAETEEAGRKCVQETYEGWLKRFDTKTQTNANHNATPSPTAPEIEATSQSWALSKRGRITHIPVLDDATRERLIKEGEIIVLTGKRKPGTKPKHQQS